MIKITQRFAPLSITATKFDITPIIIDSNLFTNNTIIIVTYIKSLLIFLLN